MLAQLRLSQIDWHMASACRNRLNEAALARLMHAPPERLPPVLVFHEKGTDGEDLYWLADGMLRWEAAWRRKQDTLWAEVRPGGRRDALLHAASANARHGLPRSSADKREVVMRLLSDPIWSQQSNVWIAEQCKVSHTYVGRLRKRMGKADGPRRGRDGKLRKLPAAAAIEEPAQPPPSSRDVALAELAKSKAELDIAIRATEEAAGLDPKLPTAKILKSLRAARREIVLWEKDLLDRPPEPPEPDPSDQSPQGQARAQIYAINRMDSREVLGVMQKMMSHDRQRLAGEGSRIEDLGSREGNQPATKREGRETRDERRETEAEAIFASLPTLSTQPATKRATPQPATTEGSRIEDLGSREGSQPATKRAGCEPRARDLGSEVSDSFQPATTHVSQPATKRAGRDPPPRSRDP